MAKTILLVDDEPEILQALGFLLRDAGYTVLTAADGEEALAMVQATPPDLLIADLRLPKLDGWRLCQWIKREARFQTMPVILLSALLGEESGKDDLADCSLPKPCASEKLLEAVRRLLFGAP